MDVNRRLKKRTDEDKENYDTKTTNKVTEDKLNACKKIGKEYIYVYFFSWYCPH
jgi:undecaprenyl pyrophosphate synthase